MMKKMLMAVAVSFALAPSIGSAAPISDVFNIPGPTTPGYVFSGGSGTATDAGGRTRQYSAVSPLSASYFSNLYWGVTGGNIQASNPEGTDNNVFSTSSLSGLSGLVGAPTTNGIDQITYQLAGSLFWNSLGSTASFSVPVKLRLTLETVSGGAVTGTHVAVEDGTNPSMPYDVFLMTAADLASWGNGFSVKQEWLDLSNNPVGPFFNSTDSCGGGGCLSNGISGAFWHDAPVTSGVPEPVSLALLGLGLFGLGWSRRKQA